MANAPRPARNNGARNDIYDFKSTTSIGVVD
jgi:hypothetical protein